MDPYASLAEHYDVMIDWPARIARERDFFYGLFPDWQGRRVLDIGCGTGHHSRMFADFHAQVLAFDPSAAMIARAREIHGAESIDFQEASFADLPTLPAGFDLIVILGNTLAYANDQQELSTILSQCQQLLAAGGKLVVQVVNYDFILAQESHWLPLVNRITQEREYLFLREYRRMANAVEFTVITLLNVQGSWQRIVERSLHYPVTPAALSLALQNAGFVEMQLYGNFQNATFNEETSTALIAVAVDGA